MARTLSATERGWLQVHANPSAGCAFVFSGAGLERTRARLREVSRLPREQREFHAEWSEG